MRDLVARTTLYDLVWSVPVSRLAKQLQLSDRGLAKICAREDIPVPPRGYWAKLQYGSRSRDLRSVRPSKVSATGYWSHRLVPSLAQKDGSG